MKNGIFFVLLLFFYGSCQEDDVCTEASSVNLVVKLQAATMDTITLDTLYIQYQLSDNVVDTLKMYQMNSYEKDSFQVPLRIDGGPIGLGIITSLTAPKDSIAMTYTPGESFVSKACGLQRVYENVQFQELTHFQLDHLSGLTQNITHSNEVHLLLYY